MNPILIIGSFLTMGCLAACSDNPVSIINDEWSCNKVGSINVCEVQFEVSKNSGNLPLDIEIKIRAHRISGDTAGGDGFRNDVVANKKIQLRLEPNETKKINETLKINSRVTNIVVSGYPSKG